MSMEALQLVCGVLVLYGAALCFAGYRIFRACLAAAGLVVGLWAGTLIAAELQLHDLSRILIIAGVALLGAVLAAAIYYVGVFLTGGAALGGAVLLLSTRLGHPVGVPVVAGVATTGGILAVMAHRRLVVYTTALVGALLVLVGLAPLLGGAAPPEQVDVPWLRAQVEALPVAWLAAGLALGLAGILSQQMGRRRRYGLGFAATSTAVPLLPEEEAPRRSRSRPAQPEGRTHGAICPRCGSIVDVDALLCHQCGNDRWD